MLGDNPTSNSPGDGAVRSQIRLHPGLYPAAVCGPLSLGLSVGIQLLLVAFMIWGPVQPGPEILRDLTDLGRNWFLPERDIQIYFTGCVLITLATAALVWAWNCRLRPGSTSEGTRFTTASAGVLILVSVISLVLFFGLLLAVRPFVGANPVVSRGGLMLLVIPSVLAVVIAILGLRSGFGLKANFFEVLGWVSKRPREYPSERTFRSWTQVLDVVLPFLICASIYVPNWRVLTGHLFLYDQFHHWDFFAMGPALGFSHHRALGTDVYAQYGVGWPMLLNVIALFSPLSYGLLLHTAITYGCVYFAGVYLFLRLLLKDAVWAATGGIIAITLQLFCGIELQTVLWQYPSSTVLRAPFDVWFFVSTLMYLGGSRWQWAFAMGLATGLALLFETETGLYLGATLAGFLVVLLFVSANSKKHVRAAWTACLSAVVVTCVGLTMASHGTILTTRFWVGWSEAIFKYRGGISLLPIAAAPNTTLLLFALFLATYLFWLSRMVILSLFGNLKDVDLVLGCLCFYGLCTLILFVGRSHPYNIYHVSIPFSVALVASLARLHKGFVDRGQWRPFLRQAFPLACGAGACVALVTQPAFQNYPNVFWTLRHVTADGGLSLAGTGVFGLPHTAWGFADQFDVTTKEIRVLAESGKDIAIFDWSDTKYYLASGATPWSRYSPLLPSLLTKAQVEDVKNELVQRRPDYVYFPNSSERMQTLGLDDTWMALQETLERNFVREGNSGVFEVWHPIRR